MSPKDYHRVLLSTIDLSARRWGKRPTELVVVNAVAAVFDVHDRDGIRRGLNQLELTGFVGRRDGRYLLTLNGEEIDFTIEPDQKQRLESYLAVQFKTGENGLTAGQREILFLVGAAEHFGHRIGLHTLAELRSTSLREAAESLTALSTGGYLACEEITPQIAVYGLTRSGRFELRRGDLRLEMAKYPGSRSVKATELIEKLMGVLDDDEE